MQWKPLDRFDMLFGFCSKHEYFIKLSEEGKMKVEITLNDEDSQPIIIISSSHQDEFVNIKFIDDLTSGEVKIDDLKLALKKLTAK